MVRRRTKGLERGMAICPQCGFLRDDDRESVRLDAGFTLVELLVVISIIALLLSILMPSLQRAREQAVKIVCASNARQTTLAMQMYNGDNKGFYPPDYQKTPPATYEYTVWQQHLTAYAGKNGNAFTCSNFKKSYKARFGKEVDTTYHNFYNWYTPANVASLGFNHRALSCTGLLDGWSCLSSDGSRTIKVKVEQVKRPNQLIMITDFQGCLSFGNMWADNYGGRVEWYRNDMFLKKYRHNNGANITFADNHYEWAPIKSKYFDYYPGTEDTRNPYWYNDRIGYVRK